MLYKMTHDLLTPLVFIVTLKCTFPITKNIIRDKRIILTLEMIETLTCLKDREDGCMRLHTFGRWM